MKRHWLQRGQSDRLLLVFGGWALGPGVVAGITCQSDLLLVEDYRSLDLAPEVLAPYQHWQALGFSFGVASLLHWLAATQTSPDRLVALNGTAFPCDPQKGIPADRVAATAEGLTEQSFAKFVQRAGGQAGLQIDLKARGDELRAIAARGGAPERSFDRVWIGRRDRVIPTAAQMRAWAPQQDVVRLFDGPHIPFAPIQSWEEWLQ